MFLGCKWENSCKPENSTWRDEKKCVDYKCLKTSHMNGSVMQIKIVDYGMYMPYKSKKILVICLAVYFRRFIRQYLLGTKMIFCF